MNQWTSLYAPLVGRILLGGFFLWSGIEKVLSFTAFIHTYRSAGLPWPTYIGIAAICLEVFCAIALIVDVKARIAALLLAAYLLAISVIFFSVTTPIQTQLFVENLAVLGGLLILGGSGSSPWTQKWRR